MSNFQRSGIPQTINAIADSEGTCIRLGQWSSSIMVQANSPVTIYWTKDDFDADQNGLLVSGEQPRLPLRINASVANVWLRGQGASSQVTLTAIGRDG